VSADGALSRFNDRIIRAIVEFSNLSPFVYTTFATTVNGAYKLKRINETDRLAAQLTQHL